MAIRISIDCMGGDVGPSASVAAAVNFIQTVSDVTLCLVGEELVIRAELKKHQCDHHARLSIIHADEVISMSDSLEVALRQKKKSSMRLAIDQVKMGLADVCVSAGNTGALMAISRFVLKTLPHVDRPAICSILPNKKNQPTYMLDLGANVDCSPKHLQQFAIMGTALFAAVENKVSPTVGLLNVGEEDIKGNQLVKEAAKLLQSDHEAKRICFYGNVEGNDIFLGTTDIVVCDGFVGNVALKALEGLGRFVKDVITSEFKRNWITRLGAIIAWHALQAIRQRLNPSNYNGGYLLGLRGLVIKSHGSADAYSFEWAIRRAYDAAKNGVLERIIRSIDAASIVDASSNE